MKRENFSLDLLDCQNFYIEDCEARGQSPLTCRTKGMLLGYFIEWCAGQKVRRLDQVSLDELEGYRRFVSKYRKPRDSQPLDISTQRMRLMAITGFLKRLNHLGKLESDFYKAFDLPKVKKRRLLDVPSAEDIRQIVAQTATRGFIGVRDKAILEVFYSAGIRRAELANLDFRDVSQSSGLLKIRKGKGGADRQVPLATLAFDAINAYLEQVRPKLACIESGEALFLGTTGKRIQLSALTELVGMYIARSGIGASGACHVLRHAAATHMLQNAAHIRYIQEFLGHEHLTSTERYTHVSKEELKRV